ncbi:UNVERIFIED_CONTAM: hypothetical protein FKN15_039721 [Acipenser sinensis]
MEEILRGHTAQEWNNFQVIPVSQPEVRTVSVFFHNKSMAINDIVFWLSRHCEITWEHQLMRTVRARYGVTGPKVTNTHQSSKEQRKPKERRTAKKTEKGEIVEGPAVAVKAGEGVDKAENPVVADKAEETIVAEPPVEDEAPV